MKPNANRAALEDAELVPLCLDDEHQDSVDDRKDLGMGINAATRMIETETSRLQVLTLMFIFFFGMVGHELALEGATTEFSSVRSIASSATLFQFAFCFLLPLMVTQGRALQRFPKSPRDAIPYGKLCLVVFGATALASYSLKWVTYPTKVVFKSAKLIPTMMVSTFLQGKRYGWLDYAAALLICVGAAGYAMDSNVDPTSTNQSSVPGLALLIVSVLCDALVPNLQQQFMTPPNALSAFELMVNVNAIGFAGLLASMVATGQLSEVLQKCFEFPRLSMYLTLVGLGLSTAVLAYTQLIQASGSVTAVAVATLRKVVTVILSYMFFPKRPAWHTCNCRYCSHWRNPPQYHEEVRKMREGGRQRVRTATHPVISTILCAEEDVVGMHVRIF
jgi:adenosine 3'-phospho 5'-phosphosulfate transporter B3